MNLFVSQFINKIDKKGRVSFPSIFRSALSKESKNEIVLYKSLKHNAIEGCGIERIRDIASRINKLDIFSDDQDDFSTSIFSEIVPTKLDREGRFLIPENLKRHSNITNETKFIGLGHFFQIWEPLAGIEKQKKARKRLINENKSLSLILTDYEKTNVK